MIDLVSDRAGSRSRVSPIEATKGGGGFSSDLELDTAMWVAMSEELHEEFFCSGLVMRGLIV